MEGKQLMVATLRSERTNAQKVTEQVECSTILVLYRIADDTYEANISRQVEDQTTATRVVRLTGYTDHEALFAALDVIKQEVVAMGEVARDITIIA